MEVQSDSFTCIKKFHNSQNTHPRKLNLNFVINYFHSPSIPQILKKIRAGLSGNTLSD